VSSCSYPNPKLNRGAFAMRKIGDGAVLAV
jgi:hypothetical protein